MRLSGKLIIVLLFYLALIIAIPFLLTALLSEDDSWLLETTADIDLELLKSDFKKDLIHHFSNIEETDKKQLEESRSLYRKAIKKTKSDPKLSLYLFKLSASLGNPQAYYALGKMYLFGNNITKNHNCLAEYYFRKGASLGHTESLIALSFTLSTGKCQEEPDQALALIYLHIAADTKNDYISNMILGYRYKGGIGVQKNCKQSAKYYSKVAKFVFELKKNEKFENQIGLQKVIDHNSKKDQKKQEEEKKKEEKKASFLQISTRPDDDNRMNLLGKIYKSGYGGVEMDYEKAIDYFTKSAERGNIEAKTNLGNMKLFGTGTEKNYTEAFQLFSEASEGGNAMAMNNLAVLYQYGMGTEKNLTMACKLIKKAAKKGLILAQYGYARFLLKGHACEKNESKSFIYFKRAADQGHIPSLLVTAEMYYEGRGTNKSCERSVEYYKQLSEKGEWSEDFNEAFQSWNNGEHLKALLIYEQLAELGYEIAQSNVGNLYHQMFNLQDMKAILNGNLKLIDNEKDKKGSNLLKSEIRDWLEFQRQNRALGYYYLSGNQNNSQSLNIVANFFFNGFGAERDVVRAFKTYQYSSSLKNPQASYQIGKFYELGLAGLKRDHLIAKKFYDQALSFNENSFFIMGFVYLKWGVSLFIHHPFTALKKLYQFSNYFLKLKIFFKICTSSANTQYQNIFEKDLFKKIDSEIIIIIISLFLIFAFFGFRFILKRKINQNNNTAENDQNNN
ncbi:sel-1-like protein [Anaeramoeba flamelloides]|uniref:Sel-1-like protein n=1 Tax=Anaeramoeba flamelloides TaxID=1746091 RepID=A0ABQ8XKW9_9EUKA|nr:sel-1-like protein [Anaeramoeba flamelloides]